MSRLDDHGPANSLRGPFAAIYPRLLERARLLMGHERVDHTLEPSALVHELYVRLTASEDLAR